MSSSQERRELIYGIQQQVKDNEARRYENTSSFINELNTRSQEAIRHLTSKINELVRSEDYATDGGKKYRASLLRKVRAQLRGFRDELGASLLGNTLDYLVTAYQTAYEESGETLGFNTSFSMPPKQAIIEAINYPWSGAMWSDRVWMNVDMINKEIERLVVRGLMTGESNQEIAKLINRDLINLGQKVKYVTERIIRTETARVRYVADVKCWKELGVEKVQFMAFIDNDTSKYCREHNKEIYTLGEEPMLPAHPHCRSCYVPYLEDKDWNTEMNNVMNRIESEKDKQIKEEIRNKPKKKQHFLGKAEIKNDGEVWLRNEVNYFEKGEEKYIEEYNKIKDIHDYKKYIDKMEKLYEDGKLSDDFYDSFLDDVITIHSLKSKILMEGDYRLALTRGDVDVLGEIMNTTSFFESLSDRDKEVIRDYSGSEYKPMNRYLRGQSKLVPSRIKELCADLKATLNRGELVEDTLLFRGADIAVFSEDFIDRLMSNPKSVIGSTFTDKGFMSTSISTSNAFHKDISFQILAPAGTKGAYIKEFSQFAHENEFLLQANTELEILDIKMGRSDLEYTVFCKVKNQG